MKKPSYLILLFCLVFLACKKTNDELALREKQAEVDEQLIQDFISKHNLVTSRDTSGVYYDIIDTGAINPFFTSSSLVTVGYQGRLLDGTVIAETGDFHPAFVLGNVIRGWRYGIMKIKKGGTVRLLIPSRQAYGPYDQPQIPANSVLDFTITVYDVNN